MRRRDFIKTAGAGAALMAFPAIPHSDTPAGSKPNIIFILADDLGYGELGCYGQTKIRTPRIDRLAAEGLRFSQHYSGSPVCAPSRCTLLTGKHTGHASIRATRSARSSRSEASFASISEACSATRPSSARSVAAPSSRRG